MSIDVTKAVDGSFYQFEENIQLNEDLLEGMAAKFTTDCNIKGNYVVVNNVVYVDARLTVTIDYLCSKCLIPSQVNHGCNMAVSYYLNEGIKSKVDEDGEVLGDYPYTGYTINLGEAVYQEIMLSIPTRLVCKGACKGLCPICGVDLNKEDCNCDVDGREQQLEQARNPFAKLKSLNFESGGASNGGTKA